MMKTKRERKVAKLKANENKLSQFTNDELFTELMNRVDSRERTCMFISREFDIYGTGTIKLKLHTVSPNHTWALTTKGGY